MPFSSRVGVIPYNNISKGKGGGNGGSKDGRRKQGITMEDLKKQTAIRLAQEQQRTRICSGFPQRKDRNLQEVPEQQQIHVTASPPYYHGQQTPMQNVVNYNNSNQVDSFHYEDAPVSVPGGVSGSSQQPISNSKQQRAYGRSTSVTSASSNNSFNSSSTASQVTDSTRSSSQKPSQSQQQIKSKLPHGLTVQELKEMTKARLQAEAQEADQNTLAQNLQQVQYHPQEHQAYPVNSVPVDQLASFGGFQEPARQLLTRGYPTSGATTPVSVPQSNGPPGFPTVPSTNSLNSNNIDLQTPGWQQPTPQQQKMEAWETGSVASMNSSNIGSEYLGSESATAYTDEFNEIPFSRNRSFPVGGYEAGYYDMTPNRRRACTLSPRVGLLHLHEDRPMFGGGSAELKIPSFDSTAHNNLGTRMVEEVGNRDRSYSGGAVPSFNRPRTASAPTVPFHNDLFDNSGLESNDVLPNSVVESVLGGSSSSVGGDNYSSVFRSNTKDDFASNLLQGAATPAPTPVKSSFNWGGFNSNDNGDSLANDLGSMLKLSGISDSAPTESSLVSRMDQEASLFPSLSGGGGRATGSNLFGQDQSYFDPRDSGRNGSPH